MYISAPPANPLRNRLPPSKAICPSCPGTFYGSGALLKEIQQVGFALTDMTLYLDTHPEDEEALEITKSRLDASNFYYFNVEFDQDMAQKVKAKK